MLKGEQKALVCFCLLFTLPLQDCETLPGLHQGGTQGGVPPGPLQGRGSLQEEVQVGQARQKEEGNPQLSRKIPLQVAFFVNSMYIRFVFDVCAMYGKEYLSQSLTQSLKGDEQ